MAPEQAGTPEADIWSLGAILYFAVEGVPPFSGDSADAILEAVASAAAKAGGRRRLAGPGARADPPEGPVGAALGRRAAFPAGGRRRATAPAPEPEPADERHHQCGRATAPPTTAVHRGRDRARSSRRTGVPEAPAGRGGARPRPEPDEPAPPPPPLPPKVALARMFSPDPGRPRWSSRPRRTTGSRRRPGPSPTGAATGHRRCRLVTLVLLAILFTNGREISPTKAARPGSSPRLSGRSTPTPRPASRSTTRPTGGSPGTASTPTSAPQLGRRPARGRAGLQRPLGGVRLAGARTAVQDGHSRPTAESGCSPPSSRATTRRSGSSPTRGRACSSTTSTSGWSPAPRASP